MRQRSPSTPRGCHLGWLGLVGLVGAGLVGCGRASPSRHSTTQAAQQIALDREIAREGGIELVYTALPTSHALVTSASLSQTVAVMRRRDSQADIQRVGARNVRIRVPGSSTAQAALSWLGKTGQLLIYDWEPNVIGPDGIPAPTEALVTGGPNAGQAAAGVPEYQAILRAAGRPPVLRTTDTTYTPGCTPQQSQATTGPSAGCLYGQWYLLDTQHQRVLRGPTDTEADLYAEVYNPPAKAKLRAVHVNPGTVLVEAIATPSLAAPESWYVLNDDPALSTADITHPQPTLSKGQPMVSFGWTAHGGQTFQALTRTIAHRGQEAQLPGVPVAGATQHFAVVLDGQLLSAPPVNYTTNPEGLNPARGLSVPVGPTQATAEGIVRALASGPLPLRLALVTQSRQAANAGGGVGAKASGAP